MWPYWFVMYLGNDNQTYGGGGADNAYGGEAEELDPHSTQENTNCHKSYDNT
jgi:hypothetical protein